MKLGELFTRTNMMHPCPCGHPYEDHGEETLWSNKELTKTRPCCDCDCASYEPRVEALTVPHA